MNNICLYPHPSSKNHGCEAIAISTSQIIKKYSSDTKILITKYNKEDERFGEDKVCYWYEKTKQCPMPNLKRGSFAWMEYQIKRRLFGTDATDILARNFIKEQKVLIKETKLFISIGGDNYCYGRPTGLYAVHKALTLKNKKSILWGCSIEPSAINEEMLFDLKNYTKIVARESITYEALHERGLTNVVLFPDPAFTLPSENNDLVIPENTIGINISPLIMHYSANADIVRKSFEKMLDYILKQTECNILLVPHVTASATDDRVELEKLYYYSKQYGKRIIVADERDCCRIKDSISRCRFFIGARTHATIAAYSTGVPTLVCGYSVKAKGIAKDLFGTYKNYVVPVETIVNDEELVNAFQWMYENEKEIRSHLEEIMPSYIEKAWKAGEIIQNVIKE